MESFRNLTDDYITISRRSAVIHGACAELNRIELTEDMKDLIPIERITGPIFWFARLYVHPNLRGQGVASEIMKELISHCDEHNITIINAVNNYNAKMTTDDLIDFYKRYGFEETKEYGFLFRISVK